MKSWSCPWFPFVLEFLRQSAAKTPSPLTKGGYRGVPMAREHVTRQPAQHPPYPPFARGGVFLSRLGWGRTSETLAQHNRHLGVAAAGAVKANFAVCHRFSAGASLGEQVKCGGEGERGELVTIGERRVNVGRRGQSVGQSHERSAARRTAHVARQPHEQYRRDGREQPRGAQRDPVVGRPVVLGRRFQWVGGKAGGRTRETVRSHRQERESGQLVAIIMTLEKGDVTGLPVK